MTTFEELVDDPVEMVLDDELLLPLELDVAGADVLEVDPVEDADRRLEPELLLVPALALEAELLGADTLTVVGLTVPAPLLDPSLPLDDADVAVVAVLLLLLLLLVLVLVLGAAVVVAGALVAAVDELDAAVDPLEELDESVQSVHEA